MKKTLKLTAIILALALSACSANIGLDSNATKAESKIQNSQSKLNKTNKLVLYQGDYMISSLIDLALPYYKAKFPEVEVEIRSFGDPATEESFYNYYEVLKSELMAGKGPDLVLWTNHFDDEVKVMNSGVFANINDYFTADLSFNPSDYNQNVFNTGLYKNSLFYVPIDYKVSSIITTKEAEKAANISFDDYSFEEFSKATISFIENQNSPSEWLCDTNSLDFYSAFINSGLSLVDYEAKTVIIDKAAFKSFFEWYKSVFSMLKERESKGIAFPQGFPQGDPVIMLSNKKLLFSVETSPYLFAKNYGGLLTKQTPKWFLTPSVTGKPTGQIIHKAALRNNTENSYNAYEFLKILLSDDVQSKGENFEINLPVRNESLKSLITKQFTQSAYYFGNGENDPNMYYISQLTEDFALEYVNKVSDVNIIKGYTNNIVQFVYDGMLPFLNNTENFDACYNSLCDKLKFYLQE